MNVLLNLNVRSCTQAVPQEVQPKAAVDSAPRSAAETAGETVIDVFVLFCDFLYLFFFVCV